MYPLTHHLFYVWDQLTYSCIKIPTNGRLCWFGHSSSGVDLIVSSHNWLCGHFTGCTHPKKKQQIEGGRKEERGKHGFRTTNAGREVGTFKYTYMYLCEAVTWTQRKSYTATKTAESSGHCLHCSVSLFLTTWPHVMSSECLTLRFSLTPNWLQWSLTPDWLMSFVFLFRNSYLCDLHANIDKGRFSGHSGLVKFQRCRR